LIGIDKQTADHKVLMQQLDEVKEAADNTESGDLLREKFKIFSGYPLFSAKKIENSISHQCSQIIWRTIWQKKRPFGPQ
jgi:hypothetical protein